MPATSLDATDNGAAACAAPADCRALLAVGGAAACPGRAGPGFKSDGLPADGSPAGAVFFALPSPEAPDFIGSSASLALSVSVLPPVALSLTASAFNGPALTGSLAAADGRDFDDAALVEADFGDFFAAPTAVPLLGRLLSTSSASRSIVTPLRRVFGGRGVVAWPEEESFANFASVIRLRDAGKPVAWIWPGRMHNSSKSRRAQ